MAQKIKKQQLWLIKPDTNKAPNKDCVVLAWQFVKKDQEIRYMVYFDDIDIYVESPAAPKINKKGMENIFDWGVPIKEYNLHQTTAQNVDFSDNIPTKIQNEFEIKIIEEGMDYLSNHGWGTKSFSVNILAPLLINKIDGVVGINREKDKSVVKKTKSQKSNDPFKYSDLFLPIEDLWMEKNVINTFVIDDGGSVVDVHFSVRFDDNGEDFYVVLDLTVSGIDSLSDEAESHILDEIEWAMDDIRDSEFGKYDLDPDHYLGEEINLIVEDE